MNPISFLKEVQGELKKVTWPVKSEIARLTGLVVLVSFIVGIYIGIIDVILVQTLEQIVR